jgi:hypothetical protein
MKTLEQIQYPVGKWVAQEDYSGEEIKQNIETMLIYANRYRELTAGLSDEVLAKTYREGSWNIRQVVNHVADTHLWHFLRIKQALTETNPIGVFGDVNALALLPDYLDAPIEDSLQMIESTHKRYAYLFANIPESSYARTYYHPFRQIDVSLRKALSMTVWHLKHHLGHIQIALGIV